MVKNAILKARKVHKSFIEILYDHTCTIKEYKSVKDPITKITSKRDAVIIENQPCRLSYKNVTSSNQNEANADINQIIKLFISPDIEIKEGSKIFISHEGRTTEFKHSGRPAIYNSHQEIILEYVGKS